MARGNVSGADALVVDARDDVATALRDLSAGESITIRIGERMATVFLLQDVAFGHKIALRDLAKGDVVLKYGEAIGVATEQIQTGSHVHVHNIEGIRGRGDQEKEGQL